MKNISEPKKRKGGGCVEEFSPYDEDSYDEFMSCIDLEDYPEEEAEGYDKKKKLPDWAAIKMNCLSLNDIRKIRGSAWNLMIYSNAIDRSILACYNITIFKRRDIRNHRDWVNCYSQYLFVVRKSSKVDMEIPGYYEINWENIHKEFTHKKVEQPFLYADDEKVKKRVIIHNYSKVSQIFPKIKAFWQKAKYEDYEDTTKKIGSIRRKILLEKNNEIDEKIDRDVKELEDIVLRKIKPLDIEEEEKNVEVDEATVPTSFDMEQLVAEITKDFIGKTDLSLLVKMDKSSEVKAIERLMKYKPRNFQINRRIKILTDQKVRTELESICPGLADNLFNGDSKLTKKKYN